MKLQNTSKNIKFPFVLITSSKIDEFLLKVKIKTFNTNKSVYMTM